MIDGRMSEFLTGTQSSGVCVLSLDVSFHSDLQTDGLKKKKINAQGLIL
jgi:hypothetical protein